MDHFPISKCQIKIKLMQYILCINFSDINTKLINLIKTYIYIWTAFNAKYLKEDKISSKKVRISFMISVLSIKYIQRQEQRK